MTGCEDYQLTVHNAWTSIVIDSVVVKNVADPQSKTYNNLPVCALTYQTDLLSVISSS